VTHRTHQPRSFALNLVVLVLGEGIAKLFTLVAFAAMARVLGPEQFGILEWAMALVMILGLVIDFGLGAYGAREVARRPDDISTLTAEIVGCRIWLLAASLTLFALVTFHVPRAWEHRGLMALFAATLVPTPWLLQWLFQGREWMRDVSAAQAVRAAAFAICALGLLYAGAGLWSAPVAEFTGVLACAAFTVAVYRLRTGHWPRPVLRPPAASLVRDSLPIGVSQFMWATKYTFVTVLIGLIAAPADVGQFGAALRIIVALHMFVAVYLYNLLPAASRCWRGTDGDTELGGLLRRTIRLSTWAALGGTAAGIVATPIIVGAVYGPAYASASSVMQVLLLMLACALFSAHYRAALIASDRQRYELASTAAGALLLAILLLFLYRRWGLLGASWAMVAGEFCTLAVSAWLVERRLVATGVWRDLWAHAAVVAAVIVMLLALAAQPTWLRVALIVPLIGVGLFLFDRRSVRGIGAILFPPCRAADVAAVP
jgi:O-antigen/teichoic acid export membrane protein